MILQYYYNTDLLRYNYNTDDDNIKLIMILKQLVPRCTI